jgi:iron complex outermembrane receptor protein
MVGLEGARQQYDLSRDEIKGVAFTQGYNFLLPRAGAILRLGEGGEAYVNVARGMREPGFRDIYDPEDYYGTRAHLGPEDVWDYEAGVTLRRPSWRLRANAFWMRFANEIVYAGALDDNGVPIYGNGAQSRHRGIEMEGTWNASRHFGADASLTLSRNAFTRYREYGYDGSVNVYDGNLIAGYPSVLAALTLRGDVGPVRLSLMGRRVGKFYLDNTQDNRRNPELRQQPGYVPLINPAFTVVDLSASMNLPRGAAGAVGLKTLRLDARVNNLLDKRYTAFGYVDSGEPLFIPAATRNFFLGLSAGL